MFFVYCLLLNRLPLNFNHVDHFAFCLAAIGNLQSEGRCSEKECSSLSVCFLARGSGTGG